MLVARPGWSTMIIFALFKLSGVVYDQGRWNIEPVSCDQEHRNAFSLQTNIVSQNARSSWTPSCREMSEGAMSLESGMKEVVWLKTCESVRFGGLLINSGCLSIIVSSYCQKRRSEFCTSGHPHRNDSSSLRKTCRKSIEIYGGHHLS